MLTQILAYLDNEEDQKLLEDIFHAYSLQMVTLAMSYLKSGHDAEDVVGDVFMQIAANNFDVVRSIECDVDMRNYLLKATKNRSLNVLKKKKGANISLDTVLEYDIAGVEEPSDDSFLDYICAKSEYDEILEAIHSLNDKYRNALYYHYVLGYTVPETAKLMMQSVPTTKQQLVRGKKMLVVLLEEKGVCKNGAYKR